MRPAGRGEGDATADPNASEAELIAVDGGNGDYLNGGDGDDARVFAAANDNAPMLRAA